MGKLVTFWSPYAGKAKVTSSMCAIAAQFGMHYPELDIAVSHTGAADFTLEEKIDVRIGNAEKMHEIYKRTGVSALKTTYRSASLTSEKIRRSSIPLRMKSLFLYPNAEIKNDRFSFVLLSEVLKKEFDIVFLDLVSGIQEDTLQYLEVSDMIVAVLPQETAYLAKFRKEKGYYPDDKKICVIVGGYINTAKCGKRFLQRQIDLEKNVFCGVIPLNNGFFDAMTEGRTLDFFYRNQRMRRNEENYEFIAQTKEAAENIRKKLFIA